MSKMTIIQLLNKIANGEEIPNKFKYKGYIFEYDKDVKAYKDEDINPYFLDDYININHEYELNDEIEIIEEDKKIEKLEYWVDVHSWVEGEDLQKGLKEQAEFNKNIYFKINEIIDYINKEKE